MTCSLPFGGVSFGVFFLIDTVSKSPYQWNSVNMLVTDIVI